MSSADHIETLWRALKAECCVRPDRAVRCVMVEEPAFRRAMLAALATHPAQSAGHESITSTAPVPGVPRPE